MHHEIAPIQIAICIAALVILGVQVYLWFLRPTRRGWTIPMILLTLHALLYYAVLFYDRSNGMLEYASYTNWSSILRLHGYLTVLSLEAARLYLYKCRKGPC